MFNNKKAKSLFIPLFTTLSILLLCVPHTATAKGRLSLADYFCQVKTYNMGLASYSLIGQGAKERVGEGRLIMKPTLFAEGQYLKDAYNPNWSPLTGSSSSLQSYKMGLSQTTPFGLQGRVYYNYQRQKVNGFYPLVNDTQTTASSPIAELVLPLSRNWAGRETRASANLIDSQARLTDHTQRYKISLLLAEAESAYWRLAVARSIVMKRRESLHRAIQIKEWVANRVKLKLAEDADLLQAQAAAENNNLNYQAAINDERLSAQNFNTLRGSHQECVNEQLVSFSDCITFKLPLPVRPGVREDVCIAEQEKNIQVANAQLGIEKNKPNIDLYATYALNGKNPSSDQAISESFSTDYPTTAVGVRLAIPLDVNRLWKDRAAYHREISGANCQFKQKVYENFRLWDSIALKIQNAQSRLAIAAQLERVQHDKLEAERKRLSFGKTTTYQVLLFEQDYANAQITRLLIQDEILELAAQFKTFGV